MGLNCDTCLCILRALQNGSAVKLLFEAADQAFLQLGVLKKHFEGIKIEGCPREYPSRQTLIEK
jgi:hypothetical protein